MGMFLKGIAVLVVAVGTLGGMHYAMNVYDTNALEVVAELYKNDKELTTRLIEKASLTCLPELKSLVSAKARHVIPDVVVLALKARMSRQHVAEKDTKQAVLKIMEPAWKSAPEKDLVVLSKVVKEANDLGSRSAVCIVRTSIKLAEEHEEKKAKSKALLGDTPLRGT